MSLKTYQRLLDELASLDFSGRFSPYLQGEPLLDNRMPKLVAMARQTLPQAKILIQTNGDALTVENGLALFEAGLHKMIINCYDSHGDQVSRMRELVRALVKKQPDIKNVNTIFMCNFNRMIIFERPGQINREISIDDKTWWKEDSRENWAGNIPGALQAPLRKSCRRPFNQLYVHHNGNVVLCCCDWKGEVIFGNLMKNSLATIYSGPVAATYRENLARKNRNMKLCEVCNYSGDYPFIDRLLTSLSRLFCICR
jgi:radical SAM protein with 4Fe4S-binding SPASM domain